MKKRGGIKLKFEYKLLILFSVFFLVPIMLFGFMLAANLESTYRDSAKQSNRENMAETQSGIVELRDELQGIVDEIASDEYLCSLIDKDEEDFDKAIDYINRTEFIFTRLSTAISSNEMVDSVYLYHPSGEFHYVNYSDTVDRLYFPKNEQWFSRASHLGESFFLSEHNDLQTVTKTAEICSYVAPISTGQRTADCAVMKINFSSEEFYKRIRVSEVKCTQYVLTDLDGKIAAQRGSLTQDVGEAVRRYFETGRQSVTINATRYMTEGREIADTGWHIVCVTNETQLTKNATNYKTIIMMFTGVMVVIILALSYTIAALLSRPIKSMTEVTEAIKHGEPGREYSLPPIRSNFLTKDEYEGFTDAINNLMHQINVSNEIRNKQEFEILQMQINPHFIYNTLNTVKWSAKLDGNERTEQAVSALINLFKSTIRVGQTYISIREEIEQIKDYITVQSFRYDDGFDVSMNVDEGAYKYKTLKFLLQPIVENAIFHGLNMSERRGLLSIDVSLSDGNIVYVVKDNGCGMTPEQVEQMLKSPKERTGMMGIGVNNVDTRIKMYFGREYGVSVKSEMGKGTAVTMVIPAMEEENEDTDS